MKRVTISGWTDHPFEALGDTLDEPAPVRRVVAVAYDQDKYVTIRIGNHLDWIKAGYFYRTRARYEKRRLFEYDELCTLPVSGNPA